MICTLTIARYPKWFGWAGFLSMAIFRLPLFLNRRISFWKLLGCGRNGTFDKRVDWRQWGAMTVRSWELGVGSWVATPNSKLQTPDFLLAWWQFFRCELWTITLEPLEGHGTWDGAHCFGELPRQSEYEGMMGILTRATIRPGKLKRFWSHVDGTAAEMKLADGFITSIGIGEVPWIKQATFSIWESKAKMKKFAYGMQQHAEVIRKTRQENWYSEEMFVRFRILASEGSLNGNNPLAGKL
jgi:hypothetical protein